MSLQVKKTYYSMCQTPGRQRSDDLFTLNIKYAKNTKLFGLYEKLYFICDIKY